MFTHSGFDGVSASAGNFAGEMQAIDLKEEAQRLQREGRYEEALPLMKRSVALRENSHTLCLTLSELTLLYLDMLKLDEADATSRRMLREAHRYDEANQRHFAQANLEDSAEERQLGLMYGMAVQIEGLTSRPELNGKAGVVKGKLRESGRYLVRVGSTTLSLNRSKFSIQADRVVQVSAPEKQGESWVFHGTGLAGNMLASVQLGLQKLNFDELRKEFASQLCCQPAALKLVFPHGVSVDDGTLEQLCSQLESQQVIAGEQSEATLSSGAASRNITVDASSKASGGPMIGAVVELQNLAAQPELNGCQGTVTSDAGSGRWCVMLETGKRVSVKGKHLVLAGAASTAVGPALDASRDRLAQSLSVGVDRSAGRPSDIGPAAECPHGGPAMCEGKTSHFVSAMSGFLRTCLVTRQHLHSEASGKETFARAELDIFFQYWSRPEMAATISRDSYKVAFSCAVDATLDSNFAVARTFLRTGFWVRMWAKHGGAAMQCAMTTPASDGALHQVMQTLTKCMQETRTDRGTTLYLAREIPCGCLTAMSAGFEE